MKKLPLTPPHWKYFQRGCYSSPKDVVVYFCFEMLLRRVPFSFDPTLSTNSSFWHHQRLSKLGRDPVGLLPKEVIELLSEIIRVLNDLYVTNLTTGEKATLDEIERGLQRGLRGWQHRYGKTSRFRSSVLGRKTGSHWQNSTKKLMTQKRICTSRNVCIRVILN